MKKSDEATIQENEAKIENSPSDHTVSDHTESKLKRQRKAEVQIQEQNLLQEGYEIIFNNHIEEFKNSTKLDQKITMLESLRENLISNYANKERCIKIIDFYIDDYIESEELELYDEKINLRKFLKREIEQELEKSDQYTEAKIKDIEKTKKGLHEEIQKLRTNSFKTIADLRKEIADLRKENESLKNITNNKKNESEEESQSLKLLEENKKLLEETKRLKQENLDLEKLKISLLSSELESEQKMKKLEEKIMELELKNQVLGKPVLTKTDQVPVSQNEDVETTQCTAECTSFQRIEFTKTKVEDTSPQGKDHDMAQTAVKDMSSDEWIGLTRTKADTIPLDNAKSDQVKDLLITNENLDVIDKVIEKFNKTIQTIPDISKENLSILKNFDKSKVKDFTIIFEAKNSSGHRLLNENIDSEKSFLLAKKQISGSCNDAEKLKNIKYTNYQNFQSTNQELEKILKDGHNDKNKVALVVIFGSIKRLEEFAKDAVSVDGLESSSKDILNKINSLESKGSLLELLNGAKILIEAARKHLSECAGDKDKNSQVESLVDPKNHLSEGADDHDAGPVYQHHSDLVGDLNQDNHG